MHGTHTYDILRGFMLGEILRSNLSVCGDGNLSTVFVACIALEARLLDWPGTWIARVLWGIPQKHYTSFTKTCRVLGNSLRGKLAGN